MINCSICLEEQVEAGYTCECKADICLDCESNLPKCPFCRREYPSVLERIKARAAAANDKILKAYLKPVNSFLKEEFDIFKKAKFTFKIIERVNFDPFITSGMMGMLEDVKVYISVISLAESRVIEEAEMEDFDYCVLILEFLRHYHYSDKKLDDLYEAAQNILDKGLFEDNKEKPTYPKIRAKYSKKQLKRMNMRARV